MLPVIVLVVYTITFVLAWLIPGNPLDNPEGRQASPEVVEAMKKQYNLDDPVTFYFSYLGDATGISWLLGQSSRPFDRYRRTSHSAVSTQEKVNQIAADTNKTKTHYKHLDQKVELPRGA